MSESEWNDLIDLALARSKETGVRVKVTGRKPYLNRWVWTIEPAAGVLCEYVSFTCTNTNVEFRVQPDRNPFRDMKIRTVCPECFDALAAMALDEELSDR